MSELTDREQTVLTFISQYIKEHGFPPCLREISAHLNVRSTSLASYYLDRLEDAGKIRRDPKIARSIVIVRGHHHAI